MKLKKKKILFFLISVLFVLFAHKVIFAQGSGAGSAIRLEDPLQGKADNPNVLIGQIIKAALGLVGSLALLMFVYGGFTWMLSAGNTEKVQKGKNIFIWATIGLIVIFSAYGIIRFLFTDVLGIK